MSVAHAAAVQQLPPHHRDPFDRMLVSQATIEGAAIVSRDEALRPYDVTLIWEGLSRPRVDAVDRRGGRLTLNLLVDISAVIER